MSTAHAIRPAEPGLDERELRAAFARFATGVALVTADVDETPLGLIVSSFAAVSLAARHGAFARRAASPGADRFAEPDVMRDAVAVIECDLVAEHAAGDHWIVVGRVRRLEVSSDGRPLVYFAGRFGDFHPH